MKLSDIKQLNEAITATKQKFLDVQVDKAPEELFKPENQ